MSETESTETHLQELYHSMCFLLGGTENSKHRCKVLFFNLFTKQVLLLYTRVHNICTVFTPLIPSYHILPCPTGSNTKTGLTLKLLTSKF
jgi:hypothetical protein